MSQENSRIEVGKGSFPYLPIGIAVVVMISVILGAAYASRTPFGAEVTVAGDADTVINEYLAKNEKRFPTRKTYYNCAGFMDSLLSGNQSLAVAVELGAWRPGVQPEVSTGNLVIVGARKEKDGDWRIASRPVPGATYDPSPISIDDPNHPCTLAP